MNKCYIINVQYQNQQVIYTIYYQISILVFVKFWYELYKSVFYQRFICTCINIYLIYLMVGENDPADI